MIRLVSELKFLRSLKDDDFEQFANSMIETFSKNIKQGYSIPPTAFIICKDVAYVCDITFKDDKEKSDNLQCLKYISDQISADHVLLMFESYYSSCNADSTDKDQKTTYIRPSLDPNRKEALLSVLYSRLGGSKVIFYPFERNCTKNTVVFLEEQKEILTEFSGFLSEFSLEQFPSTLLH